MTPSEPLQPQKHEKNEFSYILQLKECNKPRLLEEHKVHVLSGLRAF